MSHVQFICRTIYNTIYNKGIDCYVVGIMQFSKEYWIDGAVEVNFVPGPLQRDLPITATGAFTFTTPGQMVLTKNGRGWDNPGGHLEKGETVLDALHREIEEEIAGRVIGDPVLIGHCFPRALRSHPWSDKYPKRSALPVYFAFVELDDFTPQFEVTERAIVDVDKAIDMYHRWSQQREEVFAYVREKHPHFFSDNI